MKITNTRGTPVFLFNTKIDPGSSITPTLNAPMDDILITDGNKTLLDTRLPTDADLQVLDDKLIFDDNVIFTIKTNYTKWIIILIFIIIATLIYKYVE
jgi:hypothetical protein